MNQKPIIIENLKKEFRTPFLRKRVTALDGLSFEVSSGKMVGFLGANGAGKTTTIKILLDLIRPDSGSFKIVEKESLGYLPERPYFYDYLTGFEFLKFCSSLFKKQKSNEEIKKIFKEYGLEHAMSRSLRHYSKGMLQRIGLMQATINDPELLILDEPMSGLDPDGRSAILDSMIKINKSGSTVFFSTHLISDIELYCDEVVMIHKGKLVLHQNVKTLLSKYAKGYKLILDHKEKPSEIHINTVEELQIKIDQARQNKISILEVVQQKPSLEEIFLKLKSEHL